MLKNMSGPQISNPEVAGSNPVGRANYPRRNDRHRGFEVQPLLENQKAFENPYKRAVSGCALGEPGQGAHPDHGAKLKRKKCKAHQHYQPPLLAVEMGHAL